jgi:hypothetical protein
MDDWTRPGFVEGFCEALAKRIAKLEGQVAWDDHGSGVNRVVVGDIRTTGDGRCVVPWKSVGRWLAIEIAALDCVLEKPGAIARLRELVES